MFFKKEIKSPVKFDQMSDAIIETNAQIEHGKVWLIGFIYNVIEELLAFIMHKLSKALCPAYCEH